MAAFRQMIRSFVELDGRTVFISSHLLDEVEKIADDIAIVHEGRLVLHGSVEELVAEGRQGLRLRVDDGDRAAAVAGGLPFVTRVDRRGAGELGIAVTTLDDDSAIALTRALVEAGVGVAEVTRERESLEERFLEITGGATADEVKA
jgi:ABC-type multidrug transport system ATPase subunit